MSMQSSTPQTHRCSAAAASTAPFIARRDRNCWRNAARSRGCDTGDAKITKGYRLKARHVIHTVGPVWHGGGAQRRCAAGVVLSALAGAGRRSNGLNRLRFRRFRPGVYRFPADRAARIAVETVKTTISRGARGIERVTFCCFSADERESSTKDCVCRIRPGVRLQSDRRSHLRVDVEPHHPILQPCLRRRIDLQHLGIVPRHDVMARRAQAS